MKKNHQRFMKLCRTLPPFVAYRLYYKYAFDLHGSNRTFENVRAMFGKARLSSSMKDVVDHQFAYHGCSEWLGLMLCKCLVNSGDTIFEIGANFGTETLNLAGIVGDTGLVVSVEPSVQCCEKLRSRTSQNGLRQVSIVECAVASDFGHYSLNAGPEQNSGMAYLATSYSENAEVVQTTTIDRLAEEYGSPHFIWMDIEGYELKALMGAGNVLQQKRPYIYTEVDQGHLERAGDSLEGLVNFMHALGYKCIDPSARGLSPVQQMPKSDEYYHTNWLLVPEEKLGGLTSLRWKITMARLLPRF